MTEKTSKPLVDLLDFDGLGLIIPFPSGVIYTNQVGGYACLHPEVEGIFVPLSIGHKKILYALQTHVDGNCHHLEEKDADITDKLLISDDFGYIKVDRNKLSESVESWIYVEIDEVKETFPLISGFEKPLGILTWANSD